MANISTVDGSLSVTGPKASTLAFLRLLEIAENWDYHTTLIEVDLSIKEAQINDTADNEDVVIDCMMTGAGRWAYHNNITQLMNWLNNDRMLDGGSWGEKWTIENELDWQQINNDPVTVNFSFCEEEGGFAFIGESEYSLTWDAGEILDTQVDVISDETYPYTAENLSNIMGMEDVYDITPYSAKWINDHLYQTEWKVYVDEYIEGDFDLSHVGKDSINEGQDFVIAYMKTYNEMFDPDNGFSIWWSIDEWFEDPDVQIILKQTFINMSKK